MKRTKSSQKTLGRAAALLAGVLVGLSVMTVPVQAAPRKMQDGGIFDADYYAQNNPDVVKAYGTTDPSTLYSHYENFGKAEGRLPYAPGTDVSGLTSGDTAADTSAPAAAIPPYGCTYVGTASGYPVYLVTTDGIYATANLTSMPSLAVSSEYGGVPYVLAADSDSDWIGVFGKLNYTSSDGSVTFSSYPLAYYLFPNNALALTTSHNRGTSLTPSSLITLSNSAPSTLVFGILNGQLWMFDMTYVQ